MGCDIHVHAERRDGDQWVRVELPKLTLKIGSDSTFQECPFGSRSYRKFGFLAGVRNYSAIPPIAAPRGFPADASREVREDFDGWGLDAHTPSWLTVAELEAYDYGKEVEDRRVMRNGNGACTCDPGEGERTKLRDFLGPEFFESLHAVKQAGAERLVFWFDN